ncbi:MAG: pyridoxal-phosphate dependent enzyme [Armatimonadota bacterium]|nr:pyridoxal-phosphate dependent enzyme [Armatimonadota bacterium]
MTFAQVEEARRVLRAYLAPSRLVPAEALARRVGVPVFLKLETDLPTGSFKPRGALYALWTRQQRGRVTEVVAASTGNHGAAVAYAARQLGVLATIFLPRNPNPVKRTRIDALGARVVEHGADLADAAQAARAHAAATGAYVLDDATDPDLPAGTATIGCEIVEQAPEAAVLYVPMGDTALVRGVALAARHLRPQIRVIGVQAAGAPAYVLSWRAGRPVPTATCTTIADGLATRTPVAANVEAIRRLVDDVRLVSDEALLEAIRVLLLDEHVVAEPAGAAATAALLAEDTPPTAPVVLLVTGANIAPDVLRRALAP